MQKTYFGFATDHTGSMSTLRRQAARDYNATIESVKQSAASTGQDVIVSHVMIGGNHRVEPQVALRNSSLNALKPIPEASYDTSAGATLLFDSVVELINVLKQAPDRDDPNVAFAVMITTDGGDTSSRTSAPQLARMIDELQKSDRWTFVFRVPSEREAHNLQRMGIPDGNIMVWSTTSQGMEVATQQNTQAMQQYFTARSTGVRSTKSFYANMKNVTTEDVKATLEDVSAKVTLWPVQTTEHEMDIRSFVEKRLKGGALKKGAAFYQLTKSEDKVQGTKKICIRDKATNAIYYGPAARQLMGVPLHSDVRLKPDDLGKFDVFIQSTSVNRKVQSGSQILYWEDVGVSYKEGPSAR